MAIREVLTSVSFALQIRDKSGNAAYMVRQLYQKYLLPFEEYRSKKDSQPAAGLASTSVPSTSTFDRIMAAANGKGDMEVLGAVAALMDAPAAEGHAHKRLKLEPKEVSALQISQSQLSRHRCRDLRY